MKQALFGFLVLAMSAQANASAEGAIDCVSRKNEMMPDWVVKFQAANVNIYGQNDGTMSDVLAIVEDESSGYEQIAGRRNYLVSDADYKPTKYKNHTRFDLTKLIDKANFSDYEPYGCYLDLLIPNEGMSKESFEAALSVKCESGGATMTLDCTVYPENH